MLFGSFQRKDVVAELVFGTETHRANQLLGRTAKHRQWFLVLLTYYMHWHLSVALEDHIH